MSIIKVLMFIWPFIKEMVLGEKTMTDAARDNKMKVVMIFILLASIGMNMFTIDRLWNISKEYLALKREYATLVEQSKKAPTKVEKPVPHEPLAIKSEDPVFGEEDPPLKKGKKGKKSKPEKQPPTPVSDTADRYQKLREDFEKIKKREEKDNVI